MSPIYSLHKNRSSSISNETSKYYINCDAIYSANRIEIMNALQKQNDECSRVILAYLEKNHSKVNVVIKIGRDNDSIKKEYHISHHLHELNCSGFIQFICLFECCYNNYFDKKYQVLTPEKNTKKEVLIMNHFNEGSIKTHDWGHCNFHILRSIIIQTIYYLIVAYHNAGFIHNDLHLDNILITPTTQTHNDYQIDRHIIEIETNNYTCIIMDFENCFFTDKSSPIFFWKMIENIIARIGIELTNNKGDKIEASNIYEVLGYIANNKNNNYLQAINIIPMIKQMKFSVLHIQEIAMHP